MMCAMRGVSLSVMARARGSSVRNACQPWRMAMPRSSRKALIWLMTPGAVGNQSLAHAVERLQVELRGCLRRHESGGGPCHSLGDRLRIIEVVLLFAAEGTHVFGGHQAHVMTEGVEAPA